MVVDEQLATVMADHLNARSSANFCIPLPIIPALSRLALRILCLIGNLFFELLIAFKRVK